MSITREDYLGKKHVPEFIRFLADVIEGEIPLNHGYKDRFLNHVPRDFETLEDGHRKYYWPTIDADFDKNVEELDPLRDRLREAKDKGNPDEVRDAIRDILFWGAGYRKSALYSANLAWLDARVQEGESAVDILNGACDAFNDPFDCSRFGNSSFRSNAGFTKIYALARDNFLIYDSRVAAALGLIIIKYCKAETPSVRKVPEDLKLGWSAASGFDNRNPSTEGFKFPRCYSYSHSLHAQSNWRANVLLSSAIKILEDEKRVPPWLDQEDPMRCVEAALFMVGKHISDLQIAEVTRCNQTAESQEFRSLRTLKQDKPFLVREDDETKDVDLWYGKNFENKCTVNANILTGLVSHFRKADWFELGTDRRTQKRRKGSLGRWLADDAGIQTSIASYVASYLKDIGVVDYREKKRKGEIKILLPEWTPTLDD